MKKVRFTDWACGRFRVITIKVGELVTFHSGRPTDEGFESYTVEYEFDGVTVTKSAYERWRDCDGPGARTQVLQSRVECLWARVHQDKRWTSPVTYVPVGRPFKLPEWERKVDRMFDAFAVAAGY